MVTFMRSKATEYVNTYVKQNDGLQTENFPYTF